MIVPLMEANAETCGGKAGALGTLLRAGLPVPDGFVVPFDVYRAVIHDLDLGPFADELGEPDAVRRAIEACTLPDDLVDALGRGLDSLGDPLVAVRSSAADEDTATASHTPQGARTPPSRARACDHGNSTPLSRAPWQCRRVRGTHRHRPPAGRPAGRNASRRCPSTPFGTRRCRALPPPAHELARHLPNAPVGEAPELVDHVPYVPGPAETPQPWAGFFDGYDDAEAVSGHRLAQALVARFGTLPDSTRHSKDTFEVLITHAYQIAWLVRHALDAPPARWLGLNSANTALTVVEYRTGLPPTIIMFNDMSHLPPDLRWTGFPHAVRP